MSIPVAMSPIELASHPRAESHRLARERIHKLSREAALFQRKQDALTGKNSTLLGLVGSVCPNRAKHYSKKAQGLLAERDLLCTEYGISLPPQAPTHQQEPVFTVPPALPLTPGYVIINNMPIIMTMRDQPDTLKHDLTQSITKLLTRSHRNSRLAQWAETCFMPARLTNWLHERAEEYDIEADKLQDALNRIPTAQVAHLAHTADGR